MTSQTQSSKIMKKMKVQQVVYPMRISYPGSFQEFERAMLSFACGFCKQRSVDKSKTEKKTTCSNHPKHLHLVVQNRLETWESRFLYYCIYFAKTDVKRLGKG